MNHIAIAVDENKHYLKQCFVMLYSLFYYNQKDAICLRVIHTPKAKEFFVSYFEYISNFVSVTHVTVMYYAIDRDVVASMGLKVYSNLPLTTYFRLLIPKLLSTDIAYCLYLDTDLLILGDIDNLITIELESYAVAGVKTNMLQQYIDNCDLEDYYNAGVLLINLQYRGKYNISDQVISFITSFPLGIHGIQPIMGDQCGINFVCRGLIKTIDPIRNTTPIWFKKQELKSYSSEQLGYTQDQIQRTQKNPVILHFAGTNKPCDRFSIHPLKLLYYEYVLYAGLLNMSDCMKCIVHCISYIANTDGLLYNIRYLLKHHTK